MYTLLMIIAIGFNFVALYNLYKEVEAYKVKDVTAELVHEKNYYKYLCYAFVLNYIAEVCFKVAS